MKHAHFTRKITRGIAHHRVLLAGFAMAALVIVSALGVTALLPPLPRHQTVVAMATPKPTITPVVKPASAKKPVVKPHQTTKPQTPPPAAVPQVPTTYHLPKPVVNRTSSAPKRVAATSAAPKPAASLAPAPTPKQPTLPPAPTVPGSPSYTSTNWAGYMATTQDYTSVSATWTIPTATSSGPANNADATWIGIGGVSSHDLIQIGTENTIGGSTLSSAAFYELLPASAVFPTSVIVSAGDTISASLDETAPGVWLASLTDDTTGQNFSATLDYASSNSSSEWIEEDPSYSNGSLVPLDDFGSVSFSGSTTTANGVSQTIAGSGAGSVTLVNYSGTPLVTVSSLGSDGGSFSISQQ